MIEKVSEVAGGIVDGLKSSPALLAILVTNLCTLGIIVWFARETMISRAEIIAKLLEMCAGVGK